MITVNKTCAMCGTNHALQVRENDLERIQNGEHIQHAMPYLTADERELFISSICGKCFDEIFAEGDEDD